MTVKALMMALAEARRDGPGRLGSGLRRGRAGMGLERREKRRTTP
jgi:hypothetical protein